MRKVIRALPKSWEVKATTLKELNDKEEMDFSEFIKNLKTHEMERNNMEEREPQKKKSIAFKATPSFQEDDEDMDEEDEDEFAMVVRKVGKMFCKQGKMSNYRRGRLQGKGERRKDEVWPCIHLQKAGTPHCGVFYSRSNKLKKNAQEQFYGGNVG